jgi:hypothetical protein
MAWPELIVYAGVRLRTIRVRLGHCTRDVVQGWINFCRRASMGALGLLLLAFGGCGGKSNLRLLYGDVQTLDRIYQASSTTLKNVSTEIRVLGDGAVEIVKQGDEAEKGDGDGTLWLPIVLVRELPEYYEAKGKYGGKTPELEAYQLDGGLWCIAAVTGPLPPRNRANLSSESSDTDSGGIHVLLYSKKYISELPILVPAERNGARSNISISLPAKSRFYSTEIISRLETAERLRQRETQLTELPPAIAPGVVKAAGDVDSADVVAWDFSRVSFWVPGSFWRLRPWSLPTGLFALFAVLAAWFWYYPLGEGERGITELDDAALSRIESAVISGLGGLTGAAARTFRYAPEFLNDSVFFLRSTEALINLRDELPDLKWGERNFSTIRRMVDDLDSLLYAGWEREKRVASSIPEADLNLRAFYLREIVTSFRSLERIREERGYAERRNVLKQAGWIFAILGLASAIWFLATIASGQTAAKPSPPARAGALADMNVLVVPHDVHGADRDKVGVTLRFYPLTEVQDVAAPTEIGIDTGANFKMDPFPRAGDSGQVMVLQQTDRSVRLAVHASYSSALGRLKVLRNGVKSFVPTKLYLESLKKADRIEINYVVEGSQRVKERAQNGWLYWFPFDSVNVEVPLRFQELALLSQVEFQQQPDLQGNVLLAGPNIVLEENEDRTKYRIAAKDDPHPLSVWPGTELRLVATLERRPLQKYSLTAGMLLVGVFLGLLIGKLMSLKDSAAIQILVGAVGILGLPLAVRAIVFDHYKELPTIATGLGITVFECVFFLAIVVVAIVSFTAKRWFK